MNIKIFLLLAFIFPGTLTQVEKELEMIGIYQLDPEYSERFDLSGLTLGKRDVFAIADKKDNRYVYKVEFKGQNFYVEKSEELIFENNPDLEGIDYSQRNFYIIDERTNKVYCIDNRWEKKEISVNYGHLKEDFQENGQNKGLEGVAVDRKSGKMYIAKERGPRYILEVDMNSGEILKKFNIPESENPDFSDLKLENGFLYAIERNSFRISKIDLKTYEKVDEVSYAHVCNSPEGKLYEPSKFGMAEALLLKKDEIWIGIDNNYVKASPHAQKTYNLKGKNPCIIKFKRPSGF